MFCSHCGAKIEQNYQYCPKCGETLLSSTSNESNSSFASDNQTESDPSTLQVPPQKKKMPFWFKLLISLVLLALVAVTAVILFTESLVKIVDDQLIALRQNNIEKAYYQYTSKDFQAATSLEKFKTFIEAYPAFLQNQSATFTERSMENHIGTLKGKITAHDHTITPIEYKLIKEDGKWKILSIRMLNPDSQKRSKEINETSKAMLNLVQSQIQAIENKQIESAYKRYTSKEFQEATSFEAFEEFIRKYPIISSHDSISLHKPIIKKNIATLAAILHSKETAAYLKYYLINENKQWKIWSMRILSSAEGEEDEKKAVAKSKESSPLIPAALEFTKVSLSDEVDEQDLIQEPKSVFNQTTGDIYVNVEGTNGQVGEYVTLSLKHIESKKSLSPLKIEIERDGDFLVISVFSPPAKGWPIGHYELLVGSSTNLNETLHFEVTE